MTCVRGGEGVERERDEHRALALGEVVPGRLARGLRIAEHPEQVVAQLERLAERQPEPGELADRLTGRPGEGRADVERTLDGVLGGLVAQHVHGQVDVARAAGLGAHVEELAGHDLAAREVEERLGGAHPLAVEAAGAQQLVGPAEQQVAEQDRGRGAVLLRVPAPARALVQRAELAVRGGTPPSYVGGVHVVVVDQRAGVQQLERPAGAYECRLVLGRDPAGHGVVAPVAERGTEPLAPDDAGASRRDQALGVLAEPVEPNCVLVDEAEQLLLDVVTEGGCVPGRVPRRVRRCHRDTVVPVSFSACLRPLCVSET